MLIQRKFAIGLSFWIISRRAPRLHVPPINFLITNQKISKISSEEKRAENGDDRECRVDTVTAA